MLRGHQPKEFGTKMKSIAFFNNKGGVGKTTLLCNVAGYLATEMKMKICVIDADPQCNATQYFLPSDTVNRLYADDTGDFTIHSAIEPLVIGEGFTEELKFIRSQNFNLDVLPGDPRLALVEDFLANDWASAKSGDIRGIKSNLVFSDLYSRMQEYDIVFIDVSPSLGAINRSILLCSNYFLSPMSIDIFSLRAFENIADWLRDWGRDWDRGISIAKDSGRKLPNLDYGQAQFLGYVTQQYLAKKDRFGDRRGVGAYEKIRDKIDEKIIASGLAKDWPAVPFELGTVPNLFSLIPMSQTSNKPVFSLVTNDGVVGAHFAKVKDAKEIFGTVSNELLKRIK